MAFEIENQLPLDDGLNAYRIRAAVLEEYSKRGMPMPQVPMWQAVNSAPVAYQGDIPHDLTVLSDQQLGHYMSMLSLWINYVGIQMALARMERTISRHQLEFTEATIRLSYKRDEEGKKRTSQERDDMVRCDRRFVEANRTYVFLDSFATLIEVVYKSAEQNFNAVSRRITQRGQDTDRGNRGQHVNNLPSGASLFPRRAS